MPWLPELFTAPALERISSTARHDLAAVPYFQGLASGETEALVEETMIALDGERGRVELPVAVAAARIYEDSDPP